MNRLTTLKNSAWPVTRFLYFSIGIISFILSFNSNLSAQACSIEPVCITDTVFCGDSITLFYQDETFRRPEITVTGNCGSGSVQFSLVAYRTWKVNECATGVVDTIFRKWSISIPNKIDTFCIDTFLVKDIPVADLQFPADTTVACQLYTGQLPEPASSGMPFAIDENGDTTSFTLGNHCNVMIAKKDEDWGGPCDGSRVLRRYWIVKDFCQDIEIRDTQTIMVIDTVPPEFTLPSGPIDSVELIPGEYCYGPLVTFSTDSHSGCTASGTLPFLTATDACGSVSSTLVTIRGAFMEMKLNNGAKFQDLSVGKYCAEYVATDDCGNQDTAYVIIQVKDIVAPILACDDLMNISINGDQMWYNVGSLENLVQENCGIYKILGRRLDYKRACGANDPTSEVAMHYAKYLMWAQEDGDQLCTDLFEYGFTEDVPFCCADIGKTIRVEIMAIDSSCNASKCTILFNAVDGVEAQVQSVLPDVNISCDTWFKYYNDCILGDMTLTNTDQIIRCVDTTTTTEMDVVYTTDFSTDPTTDGWFIEENECGVGSITWQNNMIITDQTTTGPYCEARIDIQLDITDYTKVEFNTALSQNPAAHYEAQDFAEISYSLDGGATFYSLIKDIEVWTAEDGITSADNDASSGNTADITSIVDGNGTPTRYTSPVLNVQGNNGTLIVQFKFFNLNGVIEQYRINDFRMSGTKQIVTTTPGENCDSDAKLDSLFGTYQFIDDGIPVECHTYKDIVNCDPTSDDYLAEENVEICNGTYTDNCPPSLKTTNYVRRSKCGIIITRVFELDGDELGRQSIEIENKCPISEADFVFDNPDTVYTWNYAGSSLPILPKYDFDTPKPTLNRQLGCDNLLVNCTDKYFDPMDANADYCGLIQRIWMITTACQKNIMVMDTQCIKVYCNSAGLENYTILGSVKNYDGRPVKGVQIQQDIDGNLSNLEIDANGNFGTSIPANTMAKISAAKDYDDLNNGMSVLDILTAQRHILGQRLIDDPYQMLAADVNMDGRISGKDIIHMRRSLLQKLTDSEKMKSWRFLDKSYEFKSDNPLTEKIPETVEVINGIKTNIGLVGIKLGDLDKSVNLNRSQESKTLEYLTSEEFNNTNVVSIVTPTELEVSGLQMEIAYDSDLFEVKNIVSKGLQIDEDSYNIIDGKILINTIDEVELKANGILFEVSFVSKSSTSKGLELNLANSYLHSEVANDNGLFELELAKSEEPTLLVGQNIPNPFNEVTNIPFETNRNELVTLNVFDLTGRLIETRTILSQKGKNTFEVDAKNYTTGIYIYEIKNDKESIKNKMIVME